MILELEYEFQLDKQSPVQTSWTYFYVKGDDLTKAKTKAKTYWKKFISELGWTKKAKLTNIDLIQNAKTYTPEHIIVNCNELPPARKRTSTRQPQAQPRRTPSRKQSRTSPRSKKS